MYTALLRLPVSGDSSVVTRSSGESTRCELSNEEAMLHECAAAVLVENQRPRSQTSSSGVWRMFKTAAEVQTHNTSLPHSPPSPL